MDNLELISVKQTTEADKERNKKYLRVGTKWKLNSLDLRNSPDLRIRVEIVAIKNDIVSVLPEFKEFKGAPKTISLDMFLDTHSPTKRTVELVEAELKGDLECKEPNTKVSFHIMLGLLHNCPDLVAHRATLKPEDTIYIETVEGKQELWLLTKDHNSSVIRRRYTPHQADMFADDWIVTRGV